MVNTPSFKLTALSRSARAGELDTPHGTVLTPAFLPVGSQATVKALSPEEVADAGFNMILANAYHLYLRPGTEVISLLGGLHRFMAWNGAILTDSGGFQIFSLSPLCRVNDAGITFRSHIDGSEHNITPERAIEVQEALGADIIMALDECSAYGDTPDKVHRAMLRTHDWAVRCQKSHRAENQALWAIVQGGFLPELRRESARYLTGLDFPGYAIGGLSVGEPKEVTLSILEETVPLLPPERPRYLMGVGSPEDIVEGVARGIDIFDCALPTRVARNGALFTWEGRRNIRNTEFARKDEPVMPGCGCSTCRSFSSAYLHHLFRCEELLAYRLATIHNLTFISQLMEKIRTGIITGTFPSFHADFRANYRGTDENTRLQQKSKWRGSRGSHTNQGGAMP